jgi:hypothetical protein
MIALALLISIPLVATSVGAEHNPLMPSPQQVRYGTRHLPLEGLAIQFSSPPSPEDRFAAEQLSLLVAAHTGIRISISDTERSGRAIVLDRAGPPDPLPVPGEQPGPGSREAYDLTVATSGVKIHQPACFMASKHWHSWWKEAANGPLCQK